MYIDNENFDKWMEKLSKKLNEIGQVVNFPTL
jgi:truncated hemoglobin YjbI